MTTYKVKVNNDGTFWYKEGTNERHREDGPAVENPSGRKYWYLNGKLHREDGPAIEYANGSKRWYLNDKCFLEEKWKQQIGKQQVKNYEGEVVVIKGVEYFLRRK